MRDSYLASPPDKGDLGGFFIRDSYLAGLANYLSDVLYILLLGFSTAYLVGVVVYLKKAQKSLAILVCASQMASNSPKRNLTP